MDLGVTLVACPSATALRKHTWLYGKSSNSSAIWSLFTHCCHCVLAVVVKRWREGRCWAKGQGRMFFLVMIPAAFEKNGRVELMQRQMILFYLVDADVMGYTLITHWLQSINEQTQRFLRDGKAEKNRGQSFPIGVSITRCQAAAPVGRQQRCSVNH